MAERRAGLRMRRLAGLVKHGNRYKNNRADPDPNSSELNIRLGTMPELNPWPYTYSYKSEADKLAAARRRKKVLVREVITNRFLQQIDEIDFDKDMAGPIALERALLFARAVSSRLDGMSLPRILMFMLITGKNAITIKEAADLQGVSVPNAHSLVNGLIDLGYIEVEVKGGPTGGRRKGKMVGSLFIRTSKGRSLFRLLQKFSTRDLALITDLIDKNVDGFFPSKFVKEREKLIEDYKAIDLDF